MSAQLRAIRHYVAAKLRERLPPGYSDRVYTSRGRPLSIGIMPCVVVWSLQEEAVPEDEAPKRHLCTAQLVVAAYAGTTASDPNGADDRVDDLAELVRQVLLRADTFEGNARDLRYERADWELLETPTAEHVFACCRLTYAVTYAEDQLGSPEGNIRPLRRIGAKYDAAPAPDGTVDAEDLIQFPEPN